MSEWSLTTPPKYFPSAVATVSGWTNNSTGEVLVAIANLVVKQTPGETATTFTMTAPANATYGDGQKITFHVVPSNAVEVSWFTPADIPSIQMTLGATNVQLVFTPADSTSTSLAFEYTVKSGDAAPSGVVVYNSIALNGGVISDLVSGGGGIPIPSGQLTYTVPTTTGIIVLGA